MSKIKLGIEAKDKITGFQGIITGYANYVTGCDQFLISPKCETDKTHTRPTGEWFDDGRLEYVGIGIHSEHVSSDTGDGADMEAPIK